MRENTIRLFCFPYAGASASHYSVWIPELKQCAEVVPVELPGRGARFADPFYHDSSAAINDLYFRIKPMLRDPFVFFGHCLGALLCYELILLLLKQKDILPAHFIVSAQEPPGFLGEFPQWHELSDQELIQEIQSEGGDPDGLLDDEEAARFFLPVIRADSRMLHNSAFMHRTKVPCGITALYGSRDTVCNHKAVEQWKHFTQSTFRMQPVEGDHYFIHSNQKEVISIIRFIANRIVSSKA